MTTLRVASTTEVVIGTGLPEPLLPQRDGRARVAVLTQPAATDVAVRISSQLGMEGLTTEVVGLPDREEAKTLDVAASVYDALARFGLGRHDTIVGVGGGSATDLAGFVAGTWMRGVEVAHVPTTLLAAVDASIGGKTGVNVGGKNLVGVFWHPSRVVIDLELLSSLPTYLAREGMAEAYKMALIGDAELERVISSDGMSSDLETVVGRAIAIKARIVDADETEQGVRAFLNFGHTIGHAVEYASALSHGESVGLGMVAAAHISGRLTRFTQIDKVVDTVEKMGLPTQVDGLERARVIDLLNHDKKRDAEGLRMVLLKDIEMPVLMHVEPRDIHVGLAAIGI